MYTPDLTLIVFKQSLNYIKIWDFSYKNRGSLADKNDASSGFNSRVKAVALLTFMAYIKKYIHN